MRTESNAKALGKSMFSGLFTDRKIATKIAIGFISILAIMMLISATAYFEFGTVAQDFSGYSRVVHNSGTVSEIDRQFLAFRRYVGDTSTNLNENIAAANKVRAIVREQIKDALASIKTPERLKKMKDISDRFETYSKDFDRVTPMRLEQEKLAQEVLIPTGEKLLSQLEQLQINAAGQTANTNAASQAANNNEAMLFGEAIKIGMQLRLNVEKVIDRHDTAAVDAAKKNFTSLNLILAQIDKTDAKAEVRKNVEAAKSTLKGFNGVFLKAASDSKAVDRLLFGDMRKAAREIGVDAEAMKANSLADEKQTQQEVSSLISWANTFILALALGGFILGVVFAWLIGRIISKPVIELVPQLKKLADGDFNVSLSGLGRKDEIGEISAAVEMVVEKVGATISNIKIAATEVTSASAEISTSTTDLSQRTEEQAASLEETSASMEEISATVKKNAENARQANEFAAETNTVAEHGGAVVGEAVTAMARIEESSRKISDIIGVIDEIARQTNLLALNAAVEAARAGEAGRGFAVVASEVRSLAQRSSQAAKDIKDLITNSNSQVKDGVDLVNKAGESLNAIVASIKKVTVIVGDIANASIEQSTGIEQINKALTQMDEVTQQNSALVEENAATAKTLEHQAKSMDERVAIFRLRSGGHAEQSTDFARRADTGERRLVGPQTAAAAPSRGPAALSRGAATLSRGPAAAEPKRQPVAAPKRAAVGGNSGGPVGRMHMALAAAVDSDPDWKEF